MPLFEFTQIFYAYFLSLVILSKQALTMNLIFIIFLIIPSWHLAKYRFLSHLHLRLICQPTVSNKSSFYLDRMPRIHANTNSLCKWKVFILRLLLQVTCLFFSYYCSEQCHQNTFIPVNIHWQYKLQINQQTFISNTNNHPGVHVISINLKYSESQVIQEWPILLLSVMLPYYQDTDTESIIRIVIILIKLDSQRHIRYNYIS